MSIKAWSDQDEKQLIFLYVEDELKDVHELAVIFKKGYRRVKRKKGKINCVINQSLTN